jgi:hypothetical protein
LLFSIEEFFWRRKIQRADEKKLNFSSKKIRQMKAGLNNKYDMPKTSNLTIISYLFPLIFFSVRRIIKSWWS